MKKKVLIFIVAYNAESHIDSVLKRIPDSIFENYDYEILIIDDHSKDNTFGVAKKFQNINEDINLKVLFNPINQGYGGNQKLGYHYAIKHGFETVVLLHGDGQYAPEHLEYMIEPINEGKADAVFGSRMINKKDALNGGMPYYKYLGNIILTNTQNYLLGTDLSEFHSGYRAYSVRTLSKLPFEQNSNDFDFDTQIIIQLVISNSTIEEIPIPTFYGDEICHVNGYKYAWDIIADTFQSKLHAKNIFYKREYDIASDTPVYEIKLGYDSSHTRAIDAVAPGSKVLDIGAGTGLVAKQLKEKNCLVSGMDQEILENTEVFESYHKLDLDEFKSTDMKEYYDYVIMLDIIEHLKCPEEFLDKLRMAAGVSKPKIIITTPNIAFILVRFSLLFGNFNYGKNGILDMTHKRLFTFSSFKRLCEQTGFVVKKLEGIPAPFPKALPDSFLGKFALWMNKVGIKISKRIFAYQIYAEIEPTPTVENMLEYTINSSRQKQAVL